MDASAHIHRKVSEYTSKTTPWQCAIKAERNGVKVEVAHMCGATFDAALAAAWGKFEPAASGGLPQLVIEDASFTPARTDDDMPF
jgi:hypothetical protein